LSVTGRSRKSLFGRDDEVGCLRNVLASAEHGEPQVAVVSGEVGIGKTTLVEEVVYTADNLTLSGHCLPVESEAMPFAPITSSLRDLLRGLPSATRTDLTQQWPQAFAEFLPFEYLDRDPHQPETAEFVQLSSSGRARLFEWLLTVVTRLAAEQPVVWLIEDVQWADRSTLDLISFLGRNLDAAPVTLILTLRTDELDRDHPVKRWLVELDRMATVTRVTLPRLSREATRAQLSACLPAAEGTARQALTDVIYEHSRGNPLFTEQLVSWAHDEKDRWPESLHDLVVSRLSMLPATSRSTLDAAAVLGRAFSLDLLALVLESDARSVERDLASALERQLIRPDSTADYSFAKPLIHEILEADLMPGERRRLHEAAANAKSGLLSSRADVEFDLVGEIAHHWHMAQVDDKAFSAAVQAGLSAERMYALPEADRYFGRAAAMACAPDSTSYDDLTLDRLDLLLHTAQVAHLIGDGSRAVALIDQAAALAETPVRLAGVLERKGAYCFNTGRADEAEDAYRRALELLPDEPSVLRADVMGGLGLLAMAWSRLEEAEDACHEALTIARAVGARRAEVRALHALGVLTAYRGKLEEGIAYSRDAVAMAEELDAADELATAYIDLAHVLGLAGRFDDVAAVSQVGYAAMSRVGLARQDGSFLQANVAESLIKAGRWTEASELLAAARGSGARGIRAFPALEHEARLRVRRGDLDVAQDVLDQAHELFAEFDAPSAWRRELHEVTSELFVWSGRQAQALVEVKEGLALIEQSDEERFAGMLVLIGAQAVADLLDSARSQHDKAAVGELEVEKDALSTWASLVRRRASSGGDQPLPEAEAVAMTTEAELVRCGTSRSTSEQWEAVAAQWESLGQPFPAAYAWWRAAESLVMSKQLGHRPVTAVRRAHQAATTLGARVLVAEIEHLARWGRIEFDAPPGELSDVKAATDLGLTEREQEVMAGLLAGQTNREIADSLFISVKTSSVHVSNILRKLGVQSREEAARVAHRQISR
jgi:DNA-binding CsgD family transcriptional regulator/tetratricopeptide (TPR) repeat protein